MLLKTIKKLFQNKYIKITNFKLNKYDFAIQYQK